jgi:3-oxoadipate enol-lactonase
MNSEITPDILGHERFGHGTTPVIVLHELFGSIRTWDPMRPFLDTHRYTFIFADLRGYGRSSHLKGRHDSQEIAADVNHLADALGFERFHLVGHSMSGLAVQLAVTADAERKAPRVERAIAVTPVPTDGLAVDAETAAFFRSTAHDDDALRGALSGLTGDRYGEAFFRYKRDLRHGSVQPEVIASYLDHVVFPRGFAAHANRVRSTTPLLVVAGAHDYPGMRLDDLRRSMSNGFPGVVWWRLAESGHYPMDEMPVALAHGIHRFLAGEWIDSAPDAS